MSTKSSWEFTESFQTKMLALMLSDIGFAMKVVKYIPDERLHSDSHKYLFHFIKDKLRKIPESPTFIEIEDKLKKTEPSKRRIIKKFVAQVFETPVSPTEADFIKEKLTDYGKKNVFVDIFQTAQTFFNAKEHEKAYHLTLEGMSDLFTVNFQDDAGIPIENFEEERQIYIFNSEKKLKRVPTNIAPLDKMLSGGLEKGELGILMAAPKKGKSLGLVHMGSAAVMTRFGRVAHFVLEGTTDQTINRYLSRLTGIAYSKLVKDELTDEERARLERVGRKFKGKFDLIPFNKHWSYTVQDIDAKLRELARHGKKPDLVIVDYADLLKAPERRENQRIEQMEVYRDLKTLAMSYGVGIWTAAQAQRPQEDPDKVYLLRAKDVAEAYDKVRIADLVITLNQTPREKEYGIMRFHVDIYRSNDTDQTIHLLQNFEKMIFSSKKFGYLSREDQPSWMQKKKK